MHVAVLDPVVRALERDPRVAVVFLAESAPKQAHIDRVAPRPRRWIGRRRAAWSRVDLLITADPWSPPILHRAHCRMNVFHGVAGKYDLDDPRRLPIGFDRWDRVLFVNADRLRRYEAAGILKPGAAALVGYPKLDALVTGRYDGPAVRARLGLDPRRRTALYAPTWSPASSLNTAGEVIVSSLARADFNVIVKPHDLSFDPDPKYSGGIDWRSRLRAVERPGRVTVSDEPDATPLLAGSDVLVTDHSSIGFEFCVLDRPIVIVDAPDLPRVARINPEQIARLRSAAQIVYDPDEVGHVAREALERPDGRRSARTSLARTMFFEPGTATARALDATYALLELSSIGDGGGRAER
jgi:CDP-glycerol glycerophosphotransferase